MKPSQHLCVNWKTKTFAAQLSASLSNSFWSLSSIFCSFRKTFFDTLSLSLLKWTTNFHLDDELVKEYHYFHLELKDSVTKAVMHIVLKYGQTVNEVNTGWWQKVKKRSRMENMSRTEIKVGWQNVLNTNKWTSDQLKCVWVLCKWHFVST